MLIENGLFKIFLLIGKGKIIPLQAYGAQRVLGS
jgi:hypothetical protein